MAPSTLDTETPTLLESRLVIFSTLITKLLIAEVGR